jgi:hypothetical protein
MSIKNISNQKSVLAKLLAQENLTVEHKKVPTAYFDPKNRILCLPMWKDMSTDVYDLLVGHEVGHAWETPPEGWHDAIEKKGKGFKSFLNVVEDARIEKLIKNRYPGLKAPMYRGYKELFDQDFFGVRDRDLTKMILIDRLNVHFKLGSLMNIPFKINEQHFVTRMENLKSWEDVYNLASDLYHYEKENPTTNLDDLEEGEMYSDYDMDGDYEEGDEFEGDFEDSHKGGRGSSFNEDPESFTDRIFREKEKSLLNDSIQPYVYVNLNTVDVKNFVVPHSLVYSRTDFSGFDNYAETVKVNFHGVDKNEKFTEELDIFNPNTLFNEYRTRNTKFIAYLVKEFELRRNAAQYARASVAKTGELDTEKVWSYKLKDDLFKRVTKIPLGKNHAMIMFVDWSGSMGDNISNTIEQFLVLSDFCRKVNIPFEVYAFSDQAKRYFINEQERFAHKFSRRNKDLYFDNSSFSLLNLLSFSMSNSQYRTAQVRLLQYAKAFEYKNKNDYGHTSFGRFRANSVPRALGLGGTPLNEAILLANYIVPEFKRVNKIDVINTIFLTDGDGCEINGTYNQESKFLSLRQSAGSALYNLVLKDPETNISVTAKPGELVTSALLRMLKARSGTNLIGYFITNRNVKTTSVNIATTYGHNITPESISEYLKKSKFYSVQNVGYDEYFVVQGKDLEIQDDRLEVEGNNKRDYLKAFMKNQKAKIINRVLLNKFVEQIA